MSYEGIENIEVLTDEDSRHFDGPNIILDAPTARRAIEEGCLHDLVLDALKALELSGQNIVVVKEA